MKFQKKENVKTGQMVLQINCCCEKAEGAFPFGEADDFSAKLLGQQWQWVKETDEAPSDYTFSPNNEFAAMKRTGQVYRLKGRELVIDSADPREKDVIPDQYIRINGEPVKCNRGDYIKAAWSPDSKHLALVFGHHYFSYLRIYDMTSAEPKQLGHDHFLLGAVLNFYWLLDTELFARLHDDKLSQLVWTI